MTEAGRVDDRTRLVRRLERSGHCERNSTARAMRSVPRHEFVPRDRRERAYADRPLPIGEGQTISAPHMVSMMTDLLELESGERVLEVGTGCGYHAAVTAEVVGAPSVYSVEVSRQLADETGARLERLGYGEISIRVGDGADGWPAHGPYDACYLTCASSAIPPAIVEQVRPGGRVLAPIGGVSQELVLATVGTHSIVDRSSHGAVRFVPMRRGTE